MLTKIIRWCYYLLFLITPLLMYSKTSELFEFNKMLFIYFISIVVSGLFIIDRILHKRNAMPNTIIVGVYLIFLASQLVSTITSIDVHTSLFGYYGRFNGGLVSIISYMVLFYVFINTFDRESLIKLLKFSLVSSVIVILWGIPGKFGHDLSCYLFTHDFSNSCWSDQFRPSERMFSTLGQPNWLGSYLAIHFFIGMYFWWNTLIAHPFKTLKSFSFQKLILLIPTVYLVLNFVAVLFTRSRSSVGAVILGLIGFFVILYMMRKKEVVAAKQYLIFFAILLTLAVLIFKTGVERIDKFITLPSKTSNTKVQPAPAGVTESFDIRKIVWKGAIDLGLKYPLFGTGVETFAYSYYFTRPQEHNLTSEWDFIYNKAHNEYLNYFATTGFVGLIAYGILIGAVLASFLAIIRGKKNIPGWLQNPIEFFRGKTDSNMKTEEEPNKLLLLCFLLAYISILITNFFGFSTTTINVFFYLIPGFLIVLLFQRSSEHARQSETSQKAPKLQIAIVILLMGIGTVYLLNYFFADTLYAEADSYTKLGVYQTATDDLQRALSRHYEHVYEDKLSYTLASLAFVSAYDKKQDSAKKFIQLAQFYNDKSLKASPKNVLYWKTKAKNAYLFYETTGDSAQLNDGLEALQIAQSLSPTDPKISYSKALYLSMIADNMANKSDKNKDDVQALQAVEQSIRLKPDFSDGYLLKGQLLEKQGEVEKAREIYKYILQHINPQDADAKKALGQ